MSVKVVMNMVGMMEISNIANDKLAAPAAQRIAAAAGGAQAGYEVRKTERPGLPGWARMRVFTNTIRAMVRERSRGTLARAMGSG